MNYDKENQNPFCYFKYEGPLLKNKEDSISVSDTIEILKSIDSLFTKIKSFDSNNEKDKISLKIERIQRGSLEIYLILGGILLGKTLVPFAKSYFSKVGELLALKQFSRGKEISADGPPIPKNGQLNYKLKNQLGHNIIVNAESFIIYQTKKCDTELKELVEVLKKDKINELEYNDSINKNKPIKINYEDKPSFEINEFELLELIEFDEEIAEETPSIIGKFTEYKAMATKYPFKFQPRKDQSHFGKKFITCIIEDKELLEKCIDSLKPNSKNVIIKGIGMKNIDGSFRIIKITSVEDAKELNLFD